MRDFVVLVGMGCAGWLAGCAAVEAPPGQRSNGIVGGVAEDGYDAVVSIVGVSGEIPRSKCTGTVIGPYAVLTAKHCLYDSTSTPDLPEELRIGVGPEILPTTPLESLIHVSHFETTPGAYTDAQLTTGEDIAVVLTLRPIPVEPMPWGGGVESGDAITAVGYGRQRVGQPRQGDQGRKARAELVVTRLFRGVFLAGGEAGATCNGDSGGPAINADGVVVAALSYGPAGQRCDEVYSDGATSGYTYAEPHRELIEHALEFEPECEPEPEVCNGFDDNCDGFVDEGCAAPGALCGSDRACRDSARCESVGGERRCVTDCVPVDDLEGSACGSSLRCEPTGCGVGRCVPAEAGATGLGEPCDDDAQCAIGACVTIAGARRCGVSCSGEVDPCATSGLVCSETDAGCGACVPADVAMGRRLVGGMCGTDDDCAAGSCFEGVCSTRCGSSGDCAKGFRCRDAYCLPGEPRERGHVCRGAADCDAPLTCVARAGGATYCAAECNNLGNCPRGFVCEAGRCLPEGAPLGEACSNDGSCASRVCAGEVCAVRCLGDWQCPSRGSCLEGTCAMPPAVPADSGGCAASASASSGPASLTLVGLALALGFARRRRC